MIKLLMSMLLTLTLSSCSLVSNLISDEVALVEHYLTTRKPSLKGQDLSWVDRPAYILENDEKGEFLARLSRQDAGRHSFIVLTGQLVQYRFNRLDLTEGFETDIRWNEPRPDPANALKADAKPVCWQASLSASGVRQATRYLVQGCMNALPKNDSGPIEVVETVSVSGTTLAWKNHYWFDERGDFVRAEEQPGPGMSRWKTSVLNPIPADWPEGPFATLPEGQGVEVEVRGLRRAKLFVPPSVKSVLQPWLQVKEVDWAAVKLFRLDQNHLLEARRLSLLGELRDLSREYEFHDDRVGKGYVDKLIADVEGWKMAQRVLIKAHPARLDWLPELDHALVGKHYLLVLQSTPTSIPITGGVGPLSIPFFGSPLTSLVRQPLSASSPWIQRQQLWRVRHTTRPMPYRLNEDALDLQLQPDDELVFLWQESQVPARFRDLSRRFLALLPHRLPHEN